MAGGLPGPLMKSGPWSVVHAGQKPGARGHREQEDHQDGADDEEPESQAFPAWPSKHEERGGEDQDKVEELHSNTPGRRVMGWRSISVATSAILPVGGLGAMSDNAAVQRGRAAPSGPAWRRPWW